MTVTIWKMGKEYKVESSDTGLIRQLANADGCRLGAEYYEKERLVGLDAILPYGAKSGRRILRVCKVKGYNTPRKWSNLIGADVLTLELGKEALNDSTPLETPGNENGTK